MTAVMQARFDGTPWVAMNSSNVDGAAFASDFGDLFIRFKGGDLYRYWVVEPGVWAAFLAAPSKGNFVFRVIRANGTDSRYAYEKLN